YAVELAGRAPHAAVAVQRGRAVAALRRYREQRLGWLRIALAQDEAVIAERQLECEPPFERHVVATVDDCPLGHRQRARLQDALVALAVFFADRPGEARIEARC